MWNFIREIGRRGLVGKRLTTWVSSTPKGVYRGQQTLDSYCTTKDQLSSTMMWDRIVEETKRALRRENLLVCNSKKMENEKFFILDCEANRDNRGKFVDILSDNSWYNLFNKEKIEKFGGAIISLQQKQTKLTKLV